MLVSSVPLSLTTVAGLPRMAMRVSSSRATRMPDSEVSAASARQSRVKSSTIARMRKRLLSASASDNLWERQRRPGPQRLLAATAATDLQPFLGRAGGASCGSC